MASTVNFTLAVDVQRVPEFLELLRLHNFRSVTVQYTLLTDDPTIPVMPDPNAVYEGYPGENGAEEDVKLFDASLEHEMASRAKSRITTRRPKNTAEGKNQDQPQSSNGPIAPAPSRRSLRLTVKNEVFTPPVSPERKRVGLFAEGAYSGFEDAMTAESLASQENINKNYQCLECNALIPKYRIRVMEHVVTQHSALRNIACPICHREGSRKGNMIKHIKMVHHADQMPLDIVTAEKRVAWNDILKKCFPEFPDQQAFDKPFRLY